MIPLKLSLNESKLLIPDREQEKSFSGTRCRSAWCRARRHLCIGGAHGCLHGNHQQHHQQHRRQCFLLRCDSSWCCQTHQVRLWTTKIWIALCSKYGDQWFCFVAQSEHFSPNLPFVSRRRYIEKTKLKGIRYKIVEFNPMVLVGKVKPDSSRPDLLHPVSAASACVPSAEPSTEFLSQRNKKLRFCSSTLCGFTSLCSTSSTPGWYT